MEKQKVVIEMIIIDFYSFEDLKKQGAEHLKKYNRIPMVVLGYLTPK